MHKPTLLYIIDNLGRGGAETLLVGILKEVSRQYEIILVTLTDLCEFNKEEIQVTKKYSLGFKGKSNFLSCVTRLRKIIKETEPALVHAHLLNSSIILRMACPRHIPIVYTIHSILSSGAFNGSWIYRNLEKKVFRKEHYLIAVSENVLKDYEAAIGRPLHSYILKNYVGDQFVDPGPVWNELSYDNGIKLVAVGNIKKVKNYEYLIEAFALLNDPGISLDIYGSGEEGYIASLQSRIDEKKLPIKFKGPHNAVEQVLPGYHFFVMPSRQEGFGIAAIEAMAGGLPLILSDIPVLRDVTYNNAFFFDLDDPGSFVKIIQQIKSDKQTVNEIIAKGKEIVEANYKKEKYITSLFDIYKGMISHPGI